MSRLKETYKNEIMDAMMKKFGYKNIMQVPKLDKIVINMGVGEAKENAKVLESAVKDLERLSKSLDQSQIFIETPYRNDSLLKDLLQFLQPSTRLTVAADLTLPTAFIRTRTVAAWRRDPVTIGKRPCVFIVLA